MWQMYLVLFTLFMGLVGVFLVAYLATRLILLLLDIHKKRKLSKFPLKRRKQNVKTMIIAGSGGHTAEMLRLLPHLGDCYSPRHYVIASTDKMSSDKVISVEKQRSEGGNGRQTQDFTITHIPRSREVKQSYITSVASTLYASLYSLPLVAKIKPDLILCNGPGTCIPICVCAFLLSVLGLRRIAVVFVESICRVESLSLSGRILYYFADHVIVQWPELKDKYPLTRYLGRLA